MAGNIYLGGGGSIDQSKEIDRHLKDELKERHQPTCLYIPLAMEPAHHQAAHAWFNEGYVDVFSEVTVATNLNHVIESDMVYDVIYLGGGNTGKLLDQIYQAGFEEFLLRHHNNGGIIYGGSAGAIVLGNSILTTSSDEHSDGNNKGLNLLREFSVATHFDEEKLADMIRTAKIIGSVILAIPEESGIIIGEQGITAVGQKPVWKIGIDGDVSPLGDGDHTLIIPTIN